VNPDSEFDRAYADEQLRRARHPLRRVIKRFYLEHALEDVRGPTIDFGCGAGQLLERLPAGSVGIEINPVLVDSLRARGLEVRHYDAVSDDFALTGFEVAQYRSLIISHVLEHFTDPASVMHKMWRACARIGIDTIVAIVPGKKGFATDSTHRTFVSKEWLLENGLFECEGFRLEKLRYFPIDASAVGDHFVFHEMKMVYRRVETA
jgi:SAM-dependent methyltransferase